MRSGARKEIVYKCHDCITLHSQQNLADASDPSLERVGVRRGASGRMHTPGARWPTYTCKLHSVGYLSDSYASTNERLNFELIYQRCAIHVEIQTSMFPCLICPFRIFF